MTGFIFNLSLRQLLFRRSTLVLALVCLLPIVVAVVFRLDNPNVNVERWTARVLFLGLAVTTVMPLTALLLGTTAIGDEIEDGTVVYLLTKPIERWQILLPKLLASWLLTALLVVPATVIACVIALQGSGSTDFLFGVGAALVLGALAYVAVFVFLSVATSRALITGLVYVFVWEGAVTGIFRGTRYLSIRHYMLSIASWIAGTPSNIFSAYVGGETALIMCVIAIIAAALLANRLLRRLEVRESS
ncbi:MAG TPA: ABC transporter permease subunit [Dehalococcoidia bacterium]|jgi:ABC-2 type transport system permease protein